jgi:hypothetical protein
LLYYKTGKCKRRGATLQLMLNTCFLSPNAILERSALLSECSLDLRKFSARVGRVRRGAVQVRKDHLRVGDPANGREQRGNSCALSSPIVMILVGASWKPKAKR